MKLGVLVVAAVLLGACSDGAPRGGGAPPRPPVAVQLVAAGTVALPTKVAVTGVLAPQEELVLGLEIAGRIASLPIDVGDVVQQGAVVATLAPREFELEVALAKAAIVAAEARLGIDTAGDLEGFDVEAAPAVREAAAVVTEAKLHRDRIADLVQQRMQPGSELESAAAALSVAESRLQRARDEVRTWAAEARLRRVELLQAEKRLGDAVVSAPWTGRVAQRHAVAGQVLGAGDAVVTLLRVDPLRLRLRVPDRLAMDVAAGQPVEFTVDGGGDTVHEGRLVRVGPAIERGDRTRLVEAEVPNADGALLPGAFCRAAIVTAPAVTVVVVPRSAVVSFAGVERVFTVGDADTSDRPAPPSAPANGSRGAAAVQVAQGHIVTLGREVGELVEVVHGIEAGTRIVRDATGLAPQAPVTVE